jgi:hypothetical protein
MSTPELCKAPTRLWQSIDRARDLVNRHEARTDRNKEIIKSAAMAASLQYHWNRDLLDTFNQAVTCMYLAERVLRRLVGVNLYKSEWSPPAWQAGLAILMGYDRSPPRCA